MARKFTKNEILKKALQFKTRTEFKNSENGAYHAARKQGFLDEACKHMDVKRHSWTLKQLEDRAKNYTIKEISDMHNINRETIRRKIENSSKVLASRLK